MAGRPAILKVDIIADARKVGPGVNEAESKLSKLGGIGKKVGLAAAAGLGLAAAAAGKFALDSIGAASDVQQSFGALETIYGKNAAQVKRWASQAAGSVGLAKSEYAGLSALVGSQLQGMGVSQEKSATKSRDLIKLGADLSATYGGSVSDAVSAVSSLLKGETDPIERYGVSIKAADVSARLAAMGLDGLTGKAEKQARAQATLSLLNKQTAKTTGAFARESNTLAGQQERLSAKFTNLKATLGQKLLPVATKVVSWASDKLLPASIKLGKWLQSHLGPAFARVGRFITERLIPAASSTYSWFVDKIVPGLRRYVSPALAGIRSAFKDVAASIQENRPQLEKLLTAVKNVVEFFATKVLPILGRVIGEGWKLLGKAIGGVIDVIATLVDWIDTAIGKIQDLIGWVKSIDIPDINLPGFLGGSTGNLVTFGVRGTGDGFARGSLTTGAMSTISSSSSGAGSLLPTQTVVVDRRDLSTNVKFEGAGLVDEVAVARRLQGILDRQAQRLGRVTSYGVQPA